MPCKVTFFREISQFHKIDLILPFLCPLILPLKGAPRLEETGFCLLVAIWRNGFCLFLPSDKPAIHMAVHMAIHMANRQSIWQTIWQTIWQPKGKNKKKIMPQKATKKAAYPPLFYGCFMAY